MNMNESTQLKNLGFVVIKEAIDDKITAYIKADAVCVFVKQMQRLNIQTGSFEANMLEFMRNHEDTFNKCHTLVGGLFSLNQLAYSQKIQDICYRLKLGFPVHFGRVRLRVESKFGGHQWPDPREVFGSLNEIKVIVPITEWDSLGTIHIVPGSHKETYKPETNPDDLVRIPMSPGDILVYSPRVKHKIDYNIDTERLRWSCQFEYSDVNDAYWLRGGYDWDYPPVPTEQEIQDLFS